MFFPLVYKCAIIRKKSDMQPDFWKIFSLIPLHGAKRVCVPIRQG